MARLLLLLALFAGAPDARACGYCVEDKMAAVYDHSVVVRAMDRGHPVAFFAIEGATPARAGLRRAMESTIDATPGVDRGTARVSLESGSLSFAYDPRRPGLGPVLKAIEKALSGNGLSFSILRVLDETPATPPRAAAAARS